MGFDFKFIFKNGNDQKYRQSCDRIYHSFKACLGYTLPEKYWSVILLRNQENDYIIKISIGKSVKESGLHFEMNLLPEDAKEMLEQNEKFDMIRMMSVVIGNNDKVVI